MLQNLDDPVLDQLEKALPAYLAARRWYRAKAQAISGIAIQDVIEVGSFVILVLNVKYGQNEDLYLLPVTSSGNAGPEGTSDEPITTLRSDDGGEVRLYDAVSSPLFRTVLLRGITSGSVFQGEHGALIAKGSAPVHVPEGVIESKVSGAEQSNTSIIYGRDYILKLFRKIEAGVNPDVEVGAYLTHHGFKNTPAVIGTLEYHDSKGGSFSAGILQYFVVNQGDAWKYTLDSLATFYQRALHSTLDDPSLIGDYAASATLLGKRTAEMHTALFESGNNPDFAPEPFTKDDAIAVANEIAAQAKSSLDLLKAKVKQLPYTEQQLAQRTIDLEPQIYQKFSALPHLSTDAKRIRYHGDYHLGQVLYTGSDFMIIDFEGEPARPLSERRTKALALRDVAGMVRSFQYAAYGGIYGLVPNLPSDPESAEKLSESSAYWNSQVAKLYLHAYYETAAAKPFLPSTPEQRNLFLDAFLLQKALYEVQYELNNRPSWVGIPLRGILSLIEQ